MPSLYLSCQISPHLDFYWTFVSGSSFTVSCIVNWLICKCVQWSVSLYLRRTAYMRIGGLLLWTYETSALCWAVKLAFFHLLGLTLQPVFRSETSKPLPHPTAVRMFRLLCVTLICTVWGCESFHLRSDTPWFLYISTMYLRFQHCKDVLRLGCN